MRPPSRGWAAALMLALALVAWAPASQAHKPSDSYLVLEIDGAGGHGRWDIALRDLEHAIGLDANGDGNITWGELRQRHTDIAAYALSRLQVLADGKTCSLQAGGQLVDEHTDGRYTVLSFELHCPAAPRRLELSYGLFAELDPQHRGLLRLVAAGRTRSAVLDPAQAPQSFELAEPGRGHTFVQYLLEGIRHIWIGVDHILFLVALLLPAVLVRRDGRWLGAERLADVGREVVKVVTAFTLAHSITLSLATLGFVALPSALVESVIAASVVVAALHNLIPVFGGRLWPMAFGFGLIHGFGFASVLADLGLPKGALALALVSFNLGVEVGQLAIVALALPPAFALRHSRAYGWLLRIGSLAIAALAAIWLAERALGWAPPWA